MASQSQAWPPASGEMAERIRSHDWASTPLGTILCWPQTLRTAVEIALDSAFATFVWWGPELIELHNDMAIQILRAKHPAALGCPACAVWSDVWAMVGPLFEQVLASGAPFTAEDMALEPERGSGRETAYFTFCYSALRDESGAVAGMQAIAIETTGTVRNREELRYQRSQFQTLLEHAPIGVYLVDADLRIQQVNPIAVRVFGDLGGDLIGRDFDEVIHVLWERAYADELVTLFRHTLETGEPNIMAERAELRADRAVTEYYRWRIDRIVLPDGRHGVVCYFQDISEEVSARISIAKSETKYRALFESINHGFCTVQMLFDADNRPIDYVFLEVNDQFERDTGLVDAVGKRALELVPNLEPFWVETYGRVALTGKHARFENGSIPISRVFQVDAYRVGDPELRQVAILFEDITERKRAEEALRESEERQAFLLAFSDSLRPLENPLAIQAEATRLLGQHLNVSRVFLAMLDQHAGREVAVVARDYVAPGVPSLAGRRPLESFGPTLVRRFRAEGAMAIADGATEPILTDDDRAALEAFDVRSCIIVPLVKGGRVALLLGVHNENPRSWTPGEVTLVSETAERLQELIERARADEALREAQDESDRRQRLYEAVAGTTPDLIYVFDPDCRFTYANDALLAMWGRSWDEAIGKGLLDLGYEPWHAEMHRREIDQAMATKRPIRGEVSFLHAELGQRIHDYIFAPVLDARDEVLAIAGITRDITDIKAAEAALGESERRYRTLFDAMDEGFCIIEKLETQPDEPSDYRYLIANPAFERHARLNHPIGRTVRELVPGAESTIMDIYDHVAITGEPLRFDGFVADLDLWMEAFALRTGDPEERRVAVLFRDVTDRKQAEQRLRQSEERLRLIIEAATDYAIFTTDADACIDSWMAGAEAVFGWNADEIVGQPFALTFLPEDRAAGEPEREFSTARDTGFAPDVRWHLRKDGGPVFIDCSCHAHRDSEGRFLGVLKIGKDITERRRIEEELRESRLEMQRQAQFFDTTLTQVGDFVFVWNREEQFVYANRPLQELWDIVDRDYRGKTTAELGYPPELSELFSRQIAHIYATGETVTAEVPYTNPAGDFGYYDYTLYPVTNTDGQVELIAGMARNSTQRRLAEDELEARVIEATAELRSLSHRLLVVQEEERRHLARELHDEIGQLLTGLSFQLGAADTAAGDRLEEARRIVGELTDQVRQLSMDLRPATLDTHGLLPALLGDIDRFRSQTGIDVELRHHGVDRRFPSDVEIVAYRVVQGALTNVARHAGASSAVVQLLADTSLTVAIRDDGPGFDPEVVLSAGGLSGMRERVQLAGGILTVDAEPGRGVVITAELPLPGGDADAGS